MKMLLMVLFVLCLMGCQYSECFTPTKGPKATYKIVPGGGVGGQVVVDIQEGLQPPRRFDKHNLALSIKNIKRNRKSFYTEEAYQERLAIKQGAWDALMEWEAKNE